MKSTIVDIRTWTLVKTRWLPASETDAMLDHALDLHGRCARHNDATRYCGGAGDLLTPKRFRREPCSRCWYLAFEDPASAILFKMVWAA